MVNMNRSTVWLVPVVAALMAGCPAASDTTDASPATGGAARLREVEAGTKIDPKTHVLVMGIKAVSIELPIVSRNPSNAFLSSK